MLLDEPTNHLDVRYQLEVLHLVRGLADVFGVQAYRWVQPETGRLHLSFERLDAGFATDDGSDEAIPAAVTLRLNGVRVAR